MNQVPRRRLLTASVLTALALLPLSALAQTAPQPDAAAPAASEQAPADQATKTLDEVRVTGSRIKRAEVEGPAPVTIISSDQIKREGHASIHDALSTLTEVTGTVQADINKGPTPNAAPLNLRNLGPGRTLLLVDGRRVSDYPLPYEGHSNFANFNNIPISMVERIEVLASGGSAIYGSDAMAGVINIILKKNIEGLELRAKVGATTRGGGDSTDISWVGGTSGEKWSATYGAQWAKRQTLFAGDRDFIDSDFDADPAIAWRVKDAWPWIWGVELFTNSDGRRVTPPDGACDAFQDLPLHHFTDAGQEGIETGYSCTQARGNALWSIRNGYTNASAFGNFYYDFDNGMQAWASATLWDAAGESRQDEAPRFTLLQDKGEAWFDPQTGQDMRARRAFTVAEAGGRAPFMFNTYERSWDIAGGLRGKFGDRFDWDATLGRTEYEVDFTFPAVVQSAVDEYFLGQQLGTSDTGKPIYELNQDRFWTPMSSADLNNMVTRGTSRAKSWMNQAQFAVSGDLFEMPAGPVGFASVLEAGSQGYELTPDPLALGDDKLYEQPGGTSEGSGDRKRYAAGVEFKFPLLSTLNLTTAGRFDQYNDRSREEGNFTWNAGLEWRPVQSLLIRGAYNTTFRAPDMHYLFATSGTGKQESLDVTSCVAKGQEPSCGAIKNYYRHNYTRTGNPDLESETGKAYSYGFVWDATPNLSFTADYWRMTIDNQVSDFGVAQIISLESQCLNGKVRNSEEVLQVVPGSAECADIVSRVTRSAPGTDATGAINPEFPLGQVVSVLSGPINIASRDVAGVDLSARYRIPNTRFGNFEFSANYTNQLRNNSKQSEVSPLNVGRDTDIRTFARASAGWSKGRWDVTLFANRIGHVNGDGYGQCAPVAPYEDPDSCRMLGKLKAPIYFNLTTGYKFTDHSKVNLLVDNLLDEAEYKDPNKQFFQYANERIFSRVGREVFLEYVHNFK